MSRARNIDLSCLMGPSLLDLRLVAKQWKRSKPRSESALLMYIVYRFGRNRKRCDVGGSNFIEFAAETYKVCHLEKQGHGSCGFDLAISLDVPTGESRKFAAFKIFKSIKDKVLLSRSHLIDLSSLSGASDDAFVICLDEESLCWRIRSADKCLREIRPDQEHGMFDSGNWDFVATWLKNWIDYSDSRRPTNLGETMSKELLPNFAVLGSISEGELTASMIDDLRSISPQTALWIKISLHF